MKSSRPLVLASVVVVVLVLGLLFRSFYAIDRENLVIQTSIPKGDLIPDQRTPEEACLPYLPNVQAEHEGRVCSLEDAVNVDPTQVNAMELCVDGMSVAGCFACTFVCDLPVAE